MKIFLDPGHGGNDPGATGNGIRESDINLILGIRLGDYLLDNYKCNIMLSRETDRYVSLQNRVKMANDWKADLFISLHSNGSDNKEANGYEDYVYPTAPFVTKAIREIIYSNVSEIWAKYGRTIRGKKEENFYVLRETHMPAVLLENGFITNQIDSQLLNEDFFFENELVKAMGEGISMAMNLESNTTKGTPIVGTTLSSIEQMKQWATNRGAHKRFIDIADIYHYYGLLTTIRPEVLYAQAAKETNFGKYTGAVKPEQNNWAGIKIGSPTGDKPEDHETFDTPSEGVRAHFNHISAYTGLNPSTPLHSRYHVVKKLSWAGTVKYVEELGGKWAPNPAYGESIVKDYLIPLLNTEVDITVPEIPEKSKEKQFAELAKLFEDWLYKYGDPYSIITIRQGFAALHQEEMGIVLPLRD